MVTMDPVHSLADAATVSSASDSITAQDFENHVSPESHSSTQFCAVGPGTTSVTSTASPSASTPRIENTAIRHSLYSPKHFKRPSSPLLRKDTFSSISTQATTASMASAETNDTSYSAETSPNLHQSIFPVKDGSNVSNNRRSSSRRRTGPLSQQSRERAALIRKLGACHDCRRRRVACHPSHHDLTWEDLFSRFQGSHSPNVVDITPSRRTARPLSPASSLSTYQPNFAPDAQEMVIDTSSAMWNQPNYYPLSETRIRTPLPPGPRLDKSLSLPGIESLKNELQANVPKILSASSCGRYNSVQVLLLFWHDDDDIAVVRDSVRDLAQVFDKIYHYTFRIQAIPSSSDGFRSSWRWLSRQLNDFANDRDQRDVLKIVYYAGHTYLDENREMILASSRDNEKASICRWSGIQQILEEANADTLIIMDAAYYPSCKIVRQKGVLEILAASLSEGHIASLGRCSFTRALAEQLRIRAARATPLSAVELHAHLLSQYPQMVHDNYPETIVVTSFPAPLHAMMSGNPRIPSIFLTPLHHASPLRNSYSYENNPHLQLSMKLTDDNVDIESWNQWLRLMPEGIKEVKIDGPCQPSFR